MAATPESGDTDVLLELASQGDASAREELLRRHRERLKRMVAVRLDDRLAARVDPSDIVQDALQDATRHFADYLVQRPLPFYLWLRKLTEERLTEARRRHIQAQKRSVRREHDGNGGHKSSALLAERLVASSAGPLSHLLRDEQRRRMMLLLGELRDTDRELLVLRYLEGLSNPEIAHVLGISVGAVMTRHTRALQRLRALFDAEPSEGGL